MSGSSPECHWFIQSASDVYRVLCLHWTLGSWPPRADSTGLCNDTSIVIETRNLCCTAFYDLVPEVVVRPTSRHKNLTECNLTSFPLKELRGLKESVKLKFKINGQQNAIYISTSFFVLSPISKHATTLLLELDRVK